MLGLHSLFNKLTGRHGKKDGQSNAPLYKAVREGSVGKVRSLLKSGANPNISNGRRLTPLHQAAYWGETEIVELLLKYGAKADADNRNGWTALHSAAVSGGLKNRKEIIQLLLGHGADPKKIDKHGWTPEDYMALWECNAEAAEKLKEYTELTEGLKPPPPPPKKPVPHTPTH